jgi:hypothetical protein
MTVSGPMEAEESSVIYIGLVLGPNKADDICGKTKVTGTMQRGSTVLLFQMHHSSECHCPMSVQNSQSRSFLLVFLTHFNAFPQPLFSRVYHSTSAVCLEMMV